MGLVLRAMLVASRVPGAWAADPQPYTVATSGVDDAGLDAVLVASFIVEKGGLEPTGAFS